MLILLKEINSAWTHSSSEFCKLHQRISWTFKAVKYLSCTNEVSTLCPHVAFLWYSGWVSVSKMPSRCHHCYCRSNPSLEYLNWTKKTQKTKKSCRINSSESGVIIWEKGLRLSYIYTYWNIKSKKQKTCFIRILWWFDMCFYYFKTIYVPSPKGRDFIVWIYSNNSSK